MPRYTEHLRHSIPLLSIGLAAAALISLAADPPTPTKQPASKVAAKSTPTATKSTAAKSAVTKSTGVKSGATKSGSSTKLAAKKAPPPRPRNYAQLQPSPDRYKEIQQALADKGYFSGAPDGVWGASSTDALKRFQHDQNLSEDGKVDSLSLIALGLGPKRTASAVVPQK
jgi:peptidoglycan hydrolase-like protein with peptidoglycan-binding domain